MDGRWTDDAGSVPPTPEVILGIIKLIININEIVTNIVDPT